ncbi:MAG: glycosyltransferase family 4 protein [Pyrinomonadaceae bacterium]|nr:glycosyltransferase family 4 protein [Pyrinomonadaceae bacterium]
MNNLQTQIGELERIETESDLKKSTFEKTSKPRILMIGMHLTKTRGGISTLINEMLQSSVTENFEINYIASQAEDFGRFGKLMLALRAVFSFVFNVLRNNPALVYVHLGSNASLYRESLFIILAKVFGKKIVGHFHAGDVEEYLVSQSRIGRRFIASAMSLSDALIAVSQESAGKLRKIASRNKISVVANALNTKAFPFSPRRFAEREGANIKLLFVGAMGKLKGEIDLANAVKILRVNHSNLKITFLGFGGEKLKNYCEKIGIVDAVEFIGAVSLEKRIEFFEKADIFVLPTYAEAMPMSVIEAMAAALPCVTTDVGGIPELIDDGENGFLIEPSNVKKLAERISFLIENPQTRIEFAAKAQDKVRRNFGLDDYAVKLTTLLYETIENK